MIKRSEVTEYVNDVRGRIAKKREAIECLDDNCLNGMDKICKIIELDQLDTYKEFVDEFERIVMCMAAP